MTAETTVLPVRLAATVLLLRDSADGPEVFMVRRHEGTAFMGGAQVFPGGRVEPSDEEGDEAWCDGVPRAQQSLASETPARAVGYHVAAVRELFEEAGVLLARGRDDADRELISFEDARLNQRFTHLRGEVHSGRMTMHTLAMVERVKLALDTLTVFAHWVTPPGDTRRFDTRFFITRAPLHQNPRHDATETTHSVWLTATAAIRQSLGGQIVLPPPTWTTLREIEHCRSVEELLSAARRRVIVRREPAMIDHDGRRLLLLPGDPQHPHRFRSSDEPPLAETRFVLADGRWRPERSGT
jgi:8-oxo-dGTP pyrophosphatase MutT (NUDIX family)